MTFAITPELGIEIPDNYSYMDLRERVEAACNTLFMLEEQGLEIPEPDDVDRETAATLAMAYAADVEKTSKAANATRVAQLTSASLIETHGILKEYGKIVATHAAEIRHTVVNKLILETENPDARIRIKALELLGKMGDVALFADKKEVTVTHQSSKDIKQKLQERLLQLKQTAEGVYEAEVVPETVGDGE